MAEESGGQEPLQVILQRAPSMGPWVSQPELVVGRSGCPMKLARNVSTALRSASLQDAPAPRLREVLQSFRKFSTVLRRVSVHESTTGHPKQKNKSSHSVAPYMVEWRSLALRNKTLQLSLRSVWEGKKKLSEMQICRHDSTATPQCPFVLLHCASEL